MSEDIETRPSGLNDIERRVLYEEHVKRLARQLADALKRLRVLEDRALAEDAAEKARAVEPVGERSRVKPVAGIAGLGTAIGGVFVAVYEFLIKPWLSSKGGG